MAPQYEFVYFLSKGKGNVIRLLLEDQGIPYSFRCVDYVEQWPKEKANFPFQQLPVLVVDGETQIAQSHTILRLLARRHGLMGANDLEAAVVEMWIDQTQDIRARFLHVLHRNYEAGLAPFAAAIPDLLAPFDKQLGAGRPRHLLLGRLTAADYALYDLMFFLQKLVPGCADSAPSVKAFCEEFGDRPRLKQYAQSEHFRQQRTTGSPHLP